MSGQSIIMFVSLVAIAMAANRAEDIAYQPSVGVGTRGPASLASKKDLGFLAGKDILKHTHKLRGPLSARVELVGDRPVQDGDVFVLKGIVSADAQLNGVEFSWI